MEYFLVEHGLYGLVVGAFTFLIIGLFHPLVIKAEYYLGTKSAWIFLLMGISCIILSILVNSLLSSVILGVTAFSSLWSILEVYHQKKRAKRDNPKKKK